MSGREKRAPRLVAHRGLHHEHDGGPRENTLEAVRRALDAGADMVEIDLRITWDGAVVVLHDLTLERMWGDPRPISALTLDEVRQMGGGRRRIPLLAEVLELVRGTGRTLLIDMDHSQPAAPAAHVVRTAEQADHAGEIQTAWCGDADALRIVRQHLPQAEIWTPWYSPRPPEAEDLQELGSSVVNVRHLLVGRDFIQAVHALDAAVACWTVDEPEQARHLAQLGVDSITTNHLLQTREALCGEPRLPGGAPGRRTRELAVVSEVAAQAARATAHAHREDPGDVVTKTSPADFVTETDRSIERTVRETLQAQFPEHGIIGEEYGGELSATCWFIDPVDGTTNLVNGVPWTSFSLSLIEEGRPVVGAVLDPVGPTPIVAAEGEGAWRGGDPVLLGPSTEREDPLSGALVSTELAGARAWTGLHTLLDRLAARGCTLRIPGSGTATLAGVALGRGAAAIIHRYSPLDHAAALLIIAEAGGTVLDSSGEPSLHPSGGPVVVGRDGPSAHALWEEWAASAAAERATATC